MPLAADEFLSGSFSCNVRQKEEKSDPPFHAMRPRYSVYQLRSRDLEPITAWPRNRRAQDGGQTQGHPKQDPP